MHNNKEIQIIKDLQNRNPNAMVNVYYEYQERFVKWACKKFSSIENDKAEDIYHECLIVFIEDFIYKGRIGVKDNNTFGLTTSIINFLISIGQKKISNLLRSNNRLPFVSLDPTKHDNKEEDSESNQKEIDSSLVKEAFEGLNEKEKDLVYYKYVLGYSYEEIKDILKEKSANSLRTLCHRAMTKFRTKYKKVIDRNNN